MKLFITLTIFASLGLFSKSEIDYKAILPNKIAYTVNGGELTLTEPEKASFSAGTNMSRIAFKGTESARKFKVGDKIEFYAGTSSHAQIFTFCIIKLEVNEKKRFANYNSLSNKRVQSFPYRATSKDHPTVYHIVPNEPLQPGHYCAAFKSMNGSGNFRIATDYKINPITFEVIE